MKKITMNDVLIYLQTNPEKSLFPQVEYLDGYSDLHGIIDTFLLNQNLDWRTLSISVELFLANIEGLFSVFNYKYKTLAGTLNLEYNPIENYRMIEKGKDTNSGTINRKLSYAQQHTKSVANIGTQQNDIDMIRDKRNYTDTDSVSPMDNTGYVNKKRLQHEEHMYTDTDSIKNGAREDSNESTLDAREDNDDVTNDLTFSHELERSGNIGITTSQQMLSSERSVADFSLYKIIWNDVLSHLCYLERGYSNACEYGYFDF